MNCTFSSFERDSLCNVEDYTSRFTRGLILTKHRHRLIAQKFARSLSFWLEVWKLVQSAGVVFGHIGFGGNMTPRWVTIVVFPLSDIYVKGLSGCTV